MQHQVIDEARRGSRAAFEELAASVLDRLYGAAILTLHDTGLAEDAVQETLIQVWRDLPRLRDPNRFEPWLHSVLMHRCLDLARHVRPLRAERELPPDLVDRTDVLADVASRDLIQGGLRRLKPAQRSALVLRYYLGLSVPEMADVLQVPLGTAKSRLHSAEAAMRVALVADGRVAAERGWA